MHRHVPWRRPTVAVLTAIATVVSIAASAAGSTPTAAPAAGTATVRGAGARSAIPGSYLVRLKESASVRRRGMATAVRDLLAAHHGPADASWIGTRSFAVKMSEDDARKLASESDVDYVIQDQLMKAAAPAVVAPPPGNQTPVTWGLDRIDQHALPLDNQYAYDDSAGEGVHAYILSTGIQATHPDFGGRASGGGNFMPDGHPSFTDCNGAGTAMAGIVGGAQHGVAKKAALVGVRISDCNLISSLSAIVGGMQWVVDNAIRPAVVWFGLLDYCVDIATGDPVACPPDTAVTLINANEEVFAAGIPVIAAAGDLGRDACDKATGAAPDTIYVGATGSGDAKWSLSNFGRCVTMYAPGATVTSDDISGGSANFTGTGFAAAYVVGTAALFMGKPEFEGAGPDDIREELVTNRSTNGAITGLTADTPNRLLYTGPPGFFTIGDPLTLTPTTDGLRVFGVNKAGQLVSRTETASGWGSWTTARNKGWESVGAGLNANGRIQLAGLTPDGGLFTRAQADAAADTWTGWTRRAQISGLPDISRLVLAHNASNRMQMFAVTPQGQAYYASQSAAGSQNWGAWTHLSIPGKVGSISAAVTSDNRIEVFAADDAGRVWHAAQTSATDTNWSSFTQLGGFGMLDIAAARNSDGRMELIGVDTGGNVWRRAQATAGGSSWTGWVRLPVKTLSKVAAATNAAGVVEIVGVDNLGAIWQSRQTSAGAAGYLPWSQLDGQLRP